MILSEFRVCCRGSVWASLALLSLLWASPAWAATVPYRTDSQLASISERIVHGRVLGVRTEISADGAIRTVARLAVLEDLTGGTDAVIEVQELGGAIGGRRLVVPGTPTFVVGQEVVLCLEHTANGRWRTVALSFSAFTVEPAAEGALLRRELQNVDIVNAPVRAGQLRLLSDFRQTVADVKHVQPVRPAGAADLQPDAAAGDRVSEEFTLLGNMRWMQADSGTPVFWYREPSAGAPVEAGVNVDAAFVAATAAWTNPSTASIVLNFGGTRARNTSEDLYCSSANAGAGLVIFEDPSNSLGSGTLAIGGGCSNGSTTVVNGTTFSGMSHGFVIFNKLSAIGQKNAVDFARILAHEIGHGIGMGHTCGDSGGPTCTFSMTVNLMYPSCCYSGMATPPSIGADDLAGVNFIYPAPAAPPTDTDGDGLPDAWETAYGLNPNSSATPNGAGDDPDGDGFTNAQEYNNHTHPRGFAANTRYFAEGAINSFFDTQFALVNYGGSDAHVLLRLQPQDSAGGTEVPYPITIPAQGRATVTPTTLRGLAGSSFSAFATLIESDTPVIADRTMTWGGGYGSHAETAVVSPSATWYFAEGAVGGGFNLYYLLQNPNDVAADVKITYLRPSDAPVSKTYTVAAKARKTIDVNAEPFAQPTDISAVIQVQNGPSVGVLYKIIAERAMYGAVPGQLYGAGHESAGVTAPDTSWFLAEGVTGFFDTFILLANPGATAANVTLTYLLTGGAAPVTQHVVLPANSRRTVFVNDGICDRNAAGVCVSPLQAFGAGQQFSTTVDADQPILVERSMWWPAGAWYEAHNVAGATSSGLRWAVAEGEVGGTLNLQTYLLVANVGSAPTRLRFTFYRELSACGASATTCPPLVYTTPANAAVAAHSRQTFAPTDPAIFPSLAGQRFGTLIESLDGQPIVIERSMYNDFGGKMWAAGTAALGTLIP